jgi:hypothetical protein
MEPPRWLVQAIHSLPGHHYSLNGARPPIPDGGYSVFLSLEPDFIAQLRLLHWLGQRVNARVKGLAEFHFQPGFDQVLWLDKHLGDGTGVRYANHNTQQELEKQGAYRQRTEIILRRNGVVTVRMYESTKSVNYTWVDIDTELGR